MNHLPQSREGMTGFSQKEKDVAKGHYTLQLGLQRIFVNIVVRIVAVFKTCKKLMQLEQFFANTQSLKAMLNQVGEMVCNIALHCSYDVQHYYNSRKTT